MPEEQFYREFSFHQEILRGVTEMNMSLNVGVLLCKFTLTNSDIDNECTVFHYTSGG